MNITALPDELKKRATTLGGEPAWSVCDAREVIERLRQLDIAVVGIEIWLREGNDPQVIGWSNYTIAFKDDWKSFVEKNAASAIRELDNPIPEDALVNLTCITRSELSKKDD